MPPTCDESARVRWATIEEVDALMTEAYAVRVRDASADAPASRAHDGINLVTEHETGGSADALVSRRD